MSFIQDNWCGPRHTVKDEFSAKNSLGTGTIQWHAESMSNMRHSIAQPPAEYAVLAGRYFFVVDGGAHFRPSSDMIVRVIWEVEAKALSATHTELELALELELAQTFVCTQNI